LVCHITQLVVLDLYSNVIDKLKADKTLDESVSKVALKIAHSRRWQDAACPRLLSVPL